MIQNKLHYKTDSVDKMPSSQLNFSSSDTQITSFHNLPTSIR